MPNNALRIAEETKGLEIKGLYQSQASLNSVVKSFWPAGRIPTKHHKYLHEIVECLENQTLKTTG